LQRLGEYEKAEQIMQQELGKKKSFCLIYQKELGHMYQLFGQIKEKLKKEEEAKYFYLEALKVNPFLYTALETIVRLSSAQEIYHYRIQDEIFSLNNEGFSPEQNSSIIY
jgi:tetratricopeptide (TPR) repeat protein